MTIRIMHRTTEPEQRATPLFFFKKCWRILQERWHRRKTWARDRKLLSEMDDRMLKDIGLTRTDVWQMTHGRRPQDSARSGPKSPGPLDTQLLHDAPPGRGECPAIRITSPVQRIGIIRLNRPAQRNALTIAMRDEICACLDRWRQEPDIDVVVFMGTGSVFSAGFDLKEFQRPEIAARLYDSSSRFHRTLLNFPKVTLAAVNGPAVGGGFDLATLCDLRLCATTAYFSHPEIKLGVPPLFSPLRNIVGEGVARELCLTGRQIKADEARHLGLVNDVVPAEELEPRAIKLAESLLDTPGSSLRYAKTIFRESRGRSTEDCLRVEHDRVFEQFIPMLGVNKGPRKV